MLLTELIVPDRWRLSTVGESCEIANHLREPISTNMRKEMQGEYPYYGPTGILDYLDHFRVEGTYALIGEDGDHFLKFENVDMTLLVSGKFNVNNHAHLLKGTGDCTTEWIYNFFRRANLYSFITRQGAGRFKLNKSALQELPILIPPLPEQRKISEILGTWDEAIAATEKLIAALERRKQGLMQRLLIVPQNRSMPLNRLPEFNDKWARKPLGVVFERVTRKNDVGNQNVLTASAQHGLVSQTDYFNRVVASDNLENYYLLLKGEYAYNKSSSDGYPFGAIKQLELYEAGVLSTLYICFRLADESSDGTFYKHFFEAGGMNRGIYTVAQEGARNHGLLNIGLSDFFGLDVPVPSLAEQRQLAEFFELQDRQIETAKKHLEHLQMQKKGLMQRLLTGQVRVNTQNQKAK